MNRGPGKLCTYLITNHMNPQIERMQSALDADLLNLESMEAGSEKFGKILSTIDVVVKELNRLLSELTFESVDEEIYFFKYTKPEILARRIEEVMRYHLLLNVPIGTTELRIKYYDDELKARQSYFLMNSYHYQYFKYGLSELDHVYFLRNAGKLTVPVAEFTEIETEFSTPMTYLFAKFLAYEHIQYYILKQIALLKFPDIPPKTSHETELKWTGDSVNIVELAYGIWLTGQLNNGNASLNQIVRWLEAELQVSIGIIQRRFSEIERRKRLSQTKFIDKMKEAILQKIESGNS